MVGKNPVSMKINLQKELRTNGCNCSKSNCLKKYCECYKAGLKCSKICRCKICENMEKKEENEINLNEEIKELDNEQEKKENKNNNNENEEKYYINNDENIAHKKYDYKILKLEKISVFIKDGNLNIQKDSLLTDLKVKDELNVNKIIYSNKTNNINNSGDMNYLQRKTYRPKENYEK